MFVVVCFVSVRFLSEVAHQVLDRALPGRQGRSYERLG